MGKNKSNNIVSITLATEKVTEDGEIIFGSTKTIEVLNTYNLLFDNFYHKAVELGGQELKLFIYLITKTSVRDNRIVLLNEDREELLRNLDYSEKTFQNYISNLIKAELVLRVEKYILLLNPIYVWRGKYSDRGKALKMYYTYGKKKKNNYDEGLVIDE